MDKNTRKSCLSCKRYSEEDNTLDEMCVECMANNFILHSDYNSPSGSPEESDEEKMMRTLRSKGRPVRKRNIGNSNYSEMPEGYQPWDIWKVYHMNPWDADIQKRLLRTKAEPGMTMTESRILDYEKIIHVCQERINQLKEGYEF